MLHVVQDCSSLRTQCLNPVSEELEVVKLGWKNIALRVELQFKQGV